MFKHIASYIVYSVEFTNTYIYLHKFPSIKECIYSFETNCTKTIVTIHTFPCIKECIFCFKTSCISVYQGPECNYSFGTNSKYIP